MAAGSRIRAVTPADAEELAALYAANRDFLAPFDPIRPDDFYTADGQRARLEQPPANGFRFAIVDGGAIAGIIALSNVVRGAFDSANVGYFVDHARNGRGLATEAVAAVVEFAFDAGGLHRLEAGTLVDNVPSQRVLEKNGFERIGLARRYLKIAGEWQDHVLFQRVADGM
jgi:ribosomal-protein-alanine N-acetyltransferase